MIIHGALSANAEYVQTLSPDVRQVGVLHKGGNSPIYVAINAPAVNAGEGCFSVLPGMRRWLPRATSEGTTIHMISASTCEWEVEF
jgi:hypothetical protein